MSGLGRLIGEPPAIARQLARAMRRRGPDGRASAIAPTQTHRGAAAGRRPARSGRRPDRATTSPILTVTSALQPLGDAAGRRSNHARSRAAVRDASSAGACRRSAIWRRCRRPICRRGSGAAAWRCSGSRAGSIRGRSCPIGETPRFIEPSRARVAARHARAAVVRVRAAARAAVGGARARRSRRGGDPPATCGSPTATTHARVLQLPAPMRDPKVLRTLLLLDLESHPPSGRGRHRDDRARSGARRASPSSRCSSGPLPSPETLSTLTARLSALVGESRDRLGGARSTRIGPDGVCDGSGSRRIGGVAGAKGADGANGADRLRVLTVLRRCRWCRCDRSLRVRRCRAATSADPAGDSRERRTRPAGASRRSTRGMPQGAVIAGGGPWRTSGGWWACAGHGSPWNRDEWDVALTSGAVCRIFQDRTTERWFLEGIYD